MDPGRNDAVTIASGPDRPPLRDRLPEDRFYSMPVFHGQDRDHPGPSRASIDPSPSPARRADVLLRWARCSRSSCRRDRPTLPCAVQRLAIAWGHRAWSNGRCDRSAYDWFRDRDAEDTTRHKPEPDVFMESARRRACHRPSAPSRHDSGSRLRDGRMLRPRASALRPADPHGSHPGALIRGPGAAAIDFEISLGCRLSDLAMVSTAAPGPPEVATRQSRASRSPSTTTRMPPRHDRRRQRTS